MLSSSVSGSGAGGAELSSDGVGLTSDWAATSSTGPGLSSFVMRGIVTKNAGGTLPGLSLGAAGDGRSRATHPPRRPSASKGRATVRARAGRLLRRRSRLRRRGCGGLSRRRAGGRRGCRRGAAGAGAVRAVRARGRSGRRRRRRLHARQHQRLRQDARNQLVHPRSRVVVTRLVELLKLRHAASLGGTGRRQCRGAREGVDDAVGHRINLVEERLALGRRLLALILGLVLRDQRLQLAVDVSLGEKVVGRGLLAEGAAGLRSLLQVGRCLGGRVVERKEAEVVVETGGGLRLARGRNTDVGGLGLAGRVGGP